MSRRIVGALVCLLIVGCGDDGTESESPADLGSDQANDMSETVSDMAQPDMEAEEDMAPDMVEDTTCRAPAAADRVRKLVVAKPYLESGAQATAWTSFDVSVAGELSANNDSFNMGRATTGVAVFTPDGEWGFVAQDDGTIGVFRVSQSTGAIEVANPAYNPGTYVSSVSMGAEGRYLYAFNGSFRDVGGGVFRVAIDCETGALTNEGIYIEAKLPKAIHPISNDRSLLLARDAFSNLMANDVHIFDPNAPATLYGSTTPFTPDDAITVSMDVTHDGKFALIGNANFFEINQLGVVSIEGDVLAPVQVFEVPDPQSIVTSPFDNAAIVLATMDDSIRVYGYDPKNVSAPLASQGSLPVTEPSLLPSDTAMIERGSLTGLVFVTENVSIRRLRFETDGTVTDLGLTSTGTGVEGIAGAMGLQP